MKKGFTLLELIVVVIILGILISIAIPTFRVSIEKSRAAEGIRILGDLRSAQIRYYAQYDNYADSLTSLGFSIPSTTGVGQYFTTINVFADGMSTDPCARVRRSANSEAGTYSLYITPDGQINCTGSSNNFCAKLGYSPF